MVANAREVAALRQVEMQKEKEAQEKKKAEEEAKKAEEAAKAERDKSMSLQPGVAVGTMDPQDDEKVVYLTFDDGPSANSITASSFSTGTSAGNFRKTGLWKRCL